MRTRARAAKRQATVLFYPASVEGRWVAHCLDFDLVGTGDNPGEAFEELLGTLEAHLELLDELGDEAAPVSPAPKEYWEAVKKAFQLPPLDIGELKGWAAKYFHRRRRKLAESVPEKCNGAILAERCDLVMV